MRKKLWAYIYWVGLYVISAIIVQTSNAQTIELGKDVEGVLTPDSPSIEYTFAGTRQAYVEVVLDIAAEDFTVTMTLLNVLHDPLAQNSGINYPYFLGCYLIYQLPLGTNHHVLIEADGLTSDVSFTLHVREIPEDEADGTIQTGQTKEGVVSHSDDWDTQYVYLRKDSPVFISLRTPLNILDSIMGLFNADGELVALNDNFYSTASAILYVPEYTGTYVISFIGATYESYGPYELEVKSVPLYGVPFNAVDEITSYGDIDVFEIALFEDEVYQFTATGVDGFLPYVVLTDSSMNAVSSNSPIEDTSVTPIPGYTPVGDDSMFLFVMGTTEDMVGTYGVDAIIQEDETDGEILTHGDAFYGAIGPIGDVDEYAFTAEEGKVYSILATPTWHSLDPAIRILNIAGEEVYYNDDSVDGLFAILSGVAFPPGDYTIQVLASEEQEQIAALTGVYVLQFVEGKTFDITAPHVYEFNMTASQTGDGVHLTIPPNAMLDDTYPLSATVEFETDLSPIVFEIVKDETTEIDLPASPDKLFFITVSDAAYGVNTSTRVTLPPPVRIALIGGTPYGMAIDKDNSIYVTDANIGGVVKADIYGATEIVMAGEATGGGSYGPNALAFNHQGELFLSNARTHSVMKVSPDGATQTVVADLNYPVDIAFDENDDMIIAQIGSDTVERVLEDGTREILTSAIRNPNGLAFSPDGLLYICNDDSGSCAIYRLLEDGSLETFIEPFGQSLQGMAFDKEGNLYVADGYEGAVYRFSPDKEQLTLARWISGPTDLAFGFGDYSKTLFATNMDLESIGYFYQDVIAIPAGKEGVPLPYGGTAVHDWMMME